MSLLKEIGIKVTEEKPEKLSRISDSRRYCDYVGEARENKAFYTTNEDISCPLARFNLGLEEYNQSKLNDLAKILVDWNDASDMEKALNYLKTSKTLDYGQKYISYFPVNEHVYEKPDLVVKIGTPDEFMPLIKEVTKLTGEWPQALLSGVGGMCEESTAVPLITGRINVSLGCGGSRPHAKLEESQLLIGLPYEIYKELF